MLSLNREQLEDKIRTSLQSNPVCAFATVEGNKPKVRYMMLFQDGTKLYMATDRKTHKVDELEANPNVSLVAGYDGGSASPVLELEGTARVSDDESLKAKFWNPDRFKQWFDSPEDPDYVILEVTPDRILYTENGSTQSWEK